jgi:hypothetical protein
MLVIHDRMIIVNIFNVSVAIHNCVGQCKGENSSYCLRKKFISPQFNSLYMNLILNIVDSKNPKYRSACASGSDTRGSKDLINSSAGPIGLGGVYIPRRVSHLFLQNDSEK